MGTYLVILSFRYFSLSFRAVLISVEFCTFRRWARGGTTLSWWRELIPPALPVEECSLLIEMPLSWTCLRVVWLEGCTNSGLTGEPFRSPSLRETVAAVGLSGGTWDQQSSMRLHNLSSSPRSISACDWGLGGRLADFTTLLRNSDQQLISLKGGSPENIWDGASMGSFSGASSNYCEPRRSSSQSCRHQKLH